MGCGPLVVTSAVVQGGSFVTAVINPTGSDYWVRPRTRIGILRLGDVLLRRAHIEVSSNEIVVRAAAEPFILTANRQEGASVGEVHNLSAFTGTAAELRDAQAMFSRHRAVFAGSDDELGCTDAVQHRIRTTDEVPVTMPYRRIPPTQLEEVTYGNWCMLASPSRATVLTRTQLCWCANDPTRYACAATSGRSTPKRSGWSSCAASVQHCSQGLQTRAGVAI